MARSHIGHVHIKLGCTVVATSDTHTNLMSACVCWLVPTKTLPPTLGAQGCHASLWPLPHPLQAQPLPHRALRASIWLIHWAQSVDGLLLVFCGVQCIIVLHKLRTASVLSWGTLKLSPVAVCNTKVFYTVCRDSTYHDRPPSARGRFPLTCSTRNASTMHIYCTTEHEYKKSWTESGKI